MEFLGKLFFFYYSCNRVTDRQCGALFDVTKQNHVVDQHLQQTQSRAPPDDTKVSSILTVSVAGHRVAFRKCRVDVDGPCACVRATVFSSKINYKECKICRSKYIYSRPELLM